MINDKVSWVKGGRSWNSFPCPPFLKGVATEVAGGFLISNDECRFLKWQGDWVVGVVEEEYRIQESGGWS